MLNILRLKRFASIFIFYCALALISGSLLTLHFEHEYPEILSSKNNSNQFVAIDFIFELDSYRANQNIFQTSDANRGVRLEVDKNGFAELIIAHRFYGVKHCTFDDKLLLNTRYNFHAEFRRPSGMLSAMIDSGRVCYLQETGLDPKFDRIIFGSGRRPYISLDGSVFEPRVFRY